MGKDVGIEGTEGMLGSEATLFMSVLNGRLWPLADGRKVMSGSCAFTAERDDDNEVKDGLSLSIELFSVRDCLDGEGDGDLEWDIHDLLASLDNDRDIDLLFPSVASGNDAFTLCISNKSSSNVAVESRVNCAIST